jgi:hypothetical protein
MVDVNGELGEWVASQYVWLMALGWGLVLSLGD